MAHASKDFSLGVRSRRGGFGGLDGEGEGFFVAAPEMVAGAFRPAWVVASFGDQGDH